jgi:dTDP-4-amino-4,6-dideoxygalactose transaminase
MIKLLLSHDLLIEALQNPETAATQLIKKCTDDPGIQAWILAHAVQICASQGFSSEKIGQLIDGLAQIPNNAHLNEQALASQVGFETGLQIAAARMFKIPRVVVTKPQEDEKGVAFIDCREALDIDVLMDSQRVDFLNLNLALHPIFNRMDGWFMEIIQNTAFAGGNHVAEFEKEFAGFCQIPHAVGVSNGTDALLFALLAMGIQQGDEIITVPNTFIATTEAISQAGAVPVFVDVYPDSYNINTDLIEEKITDKTRAILPVHLYGQVADMDAIMAIAAKHHLLVLEDACQAHGAYYKGKRAGTLGHAGAFSMYPGKNLGAFGEAGCVITPDPKIAATVKRLREHGQSKKYYHLVEGYNGRMDNLQAAALRAKLPFLDEWNENRQKIARLYQEGLSEVPEVKLPVINDYASHVFHLFVILVQDPHELSAYLKQQEIHTGFHYPVPLHLQEAYAGREEQQGSYPVSEQCADQLLSLPIFPELTERQVSRVCDEIKLYYQRSASTG